MKKLPLILTSLLSICLLASCLFLYTGYENMKEHGEKLETENTTLNTDVRELNNQLQEKDSYIIGQNEYLSELNQQLANLQKPAESEDDEYSSESPSDYKDEYPDLYSGTRLNTPDIELDKTAYLTFDDGPSSLTPQVLDLLDEYNAKATFFVVYTDNPQYTSYLKDIVDRGHTLALHSYSHDYNKIYHSVDAFLEDFEKVYQWVYEETGHRATLFRFPGGSAQGRISVVNDIITEMERRGFIYYDWNVTSGDGSNLTTAENILGNIFPNVNSFRMPVVLMHDGIGKDTTLKALPNVLQALIENGYRFQALDENLSPIQYQRKSR